MELLEGILIVLGVLFGSTFTVLLLGKCGAEFLFWLDRIGR